MPIPSARTLRTICAGFACCVALASCSGSDDGVLDIAVIATPESLFADDLRLSSGAQHVRAAIESGLVTLNAQGEVVPALAETWLPSDGGRSFFFRLRNTTWPDGNTLTADSVAAALNATLADLEGTSLGYDLAPIEEVRAMAGRVVQVRLSSPEPYLLQLLAQPELALRARSAGTGRGGTGPMVMARARNTGEAGAGENAPTALFTVRPPDERGMPMDDDWEADYRPLSLTATDAVQATAMFEAGEVDIVLGGTLGTLPLVDTGPLSIATLRLNATVGLFGLRVRTTRGMLGDSGVREALAMSLDREALLDQFNLGGWISTTRLVQPGLPEDSGLVAERWQAVPFNELRAEAARRIAAWRAANAESNGDGLAPLAIWLPEGPGWDIFLADLSGQFATIGVRLARADSASEADLVLVDRVARYPAARWFLNQFHCALVRPCSEIADLKVTEALAQQDPGARAALLAEAESDLTLENIYIPIGTPLRWSLARGNVDGFAANVYAFHPLPPLAEIPR